MPNSTVVEDRSSSSAAKSYGRNIRKITQPAIVDQSHTSAINSFANANTTPLAPQPETPTAVNETVVPKSRPVFYNVFY